MNCNKCRSFGAVLVLVQGVVSALFPRVSAGVMKNMIGKNFDNASELAAKPAYLRQLRALGIGMVAAGGTTLLLESASDADSDEVASDDDETDPAESA